jgi:hypothetical protein
MIITKKLNIKNSLSKISKPQDKKLINLKAPLIPFLVRKASPAMELLTLVLLAMISYQ